MKQKQQTTTSNNPVKAKPFSYMGFRFYPKRQFTQKEMDAGLSLRGLRSIGISNYTGDMYKTQNHISSNWNYDDFYKAATKAGARNIDIFMMSNTAVVPCSNELFEYIYYTENSPSTIPVKEDEGQQWEVAIFEMPHGKEIAIKKSKYKNKNGEWMYADRICTLDNTDEKIAELIASAPQLKSENDELKEANAKLIEQRRELVELLKPFAEMYGEFPASKCKQGGTVFAYNDKHLTVKDFEKAQDMIFYANHHFK